ncbi:AIPR family protein [Herminiimonas aquatilis]|uniref:AIPR family protein n=1 Tax=Herminiimonas aquatilis TaxID=345342 RepID=A0ABW2J3H3_9BURK
MAKNDAVLLDGIIQDRMALDMLDRGEAFEMFSFQQILKSYDLTRDEIESGWVDGKDDGGIDGFYIFVNGVLLRNLNNQVWPKKNAEIDIWIISCKHKDSFKQVALNTLFPTIEELLDFSKAPSEFEGHYSERLLKARQTAVQAYLSTASALPSLNFYFAYASRGDLTELSSNIEARGKQIKRIVNDYFSAATVSIEYFGATELIALHRKARVILELPFIKELSQEQNAYVLLVPIDVYADFVSDEHGQLRRYLFDSNVRDFLGDNRVNQDIANSLDNSQSPDFWWLNNGVTILATNAMPLGRTKAGNAIQLHDVQIVNGLQTTQSIFNYFKSAEANANGRCVLVKVIISEDDIVRDSIIQATNNQSLVELAGLNATDKIQRDIEEILERNDLYYERRKNHYKNIGKPIEKFVTPLLLAVSVVALVKKSPSKAGLLKTRFMRNPTSYEEIFSEKFPIELWPKLAGVIKAVENGMIATVPKLKATGNRVLGNWRGAVALCVMAKLHGTFNFNQKHILETEIDSISQDFVESVFVSLRKLRSFKEDEIRVTNTDKLCQIFCRQEDLAGIEVIGCWNMPSGTKNRWLERNTQLANEAPIDPETLILIGNSLPKQPWPPGVHVDISRKLDLDKKFIQKAINQLIKAGVLEHQYDGVVVNSNGYVTAIDKKRADPRYKIGDKYG